MARITVEDCLRNETNRFALVLLASKRSKQILNGSKPLSKKSKNNKAVVSALREIAEGKVRFMTKEEIEIQASSLDSDLQSQGISNMTYTPPSTVDFSAGLNAFNESNLNDASKGASKKPDTDLKDNDFSVDGEDE